MNEERDLLVKDTFVKIRELCKERNIEFVPIELRWGLSSSQGKAHIISACLNEIKESQPYFIGIIGDRYGWVPTIQEVQSSYPDNSKPKIFYQYPWLERDIRSGLSMTEIEMQYAALRNGNSKALFYIKKSVDAHSEEPEKSKDKLSRLRDSIDKAENIQKKPYASSQELAAQVFEDVKNIIEKEYPLNDAQRTEKSRHQNSFERKAGGSLYDMSVCFPVIDRILSKDGTKFICLKGKDGCGKSFLLADYAAHLRKRGYHVYYYDVGEVDVANPYISFIIDFENYITSVITEDLGCTVQESKSSFIKHTAKLFFQAYKLKMSSILGAKSDQVSSAVKSSIFQYYDNVLWTPTVQQIRWCCESIQATGTDIIIAVDNLEHIPKEYMSMLSDLDYFPANVRFIYTAGPDMTLTNRAHTSTVLCDNLFRKMIGLYIPSYFKKYGKEDISSQTIEKLACSALSGTPSNLNKVLDMLVSFGSYEKLDSEIERLASISGKKALYAELAGRLVSELGQSAADVLAALALSQQSLSEMEIRDITSIGFNDWIILRPHIKELVSMVSDRFQPCPELKDAIHETLPKATLLKICDLMEKYFSSLFHFRTTGFGIVGVMEDELKHLHRQASELPYLYAYKRDMLNLGHYISFPTHDMCLTEQERVYFWNILYSAGYRMRLVVDLKCCESTSDYVLKYRSVSYKQVSAYGRSIVNPTEREIQDFLFRLERVAKDLKHDDDRVWLSSVLEQRMLK